MNDLQQITISKSCGQYKVEDPNFRGGKGRYEHCKTKSKAISLRNEWESDYPELKKAGMKRNLSHKGGLPNKSEIIRTMLDEGCSLKEIVAQVGCRYQMVHNVKTVYFKINPKVRDMYERGELKDGSME